MRNCILCKKNQEVGVSLFKVPLNDSKTYWLEFVKKSIEAEIDYAKEYFLCELHFEKNCILSQSSKKTLVPGSIPTLYVKVILFSSSYSDRLIFKKYLAKKSSNYNW